MTCAILEKISQDVSDSEVVRCMPAVEGDYLAKDDNGADYFCTVIAVNNPKTPKKKILHVDEFGEDGEPIPVHETGLTFIALIRRRGPLPYDLGAY